MLFYDLKYGLLNSSLFFCNGYRHALFKNQFLWISIRYLKIARKKKEKNNVNDFFIAVLLHVYD